MTVATGANLSATSSLGLLRGDTASMSRDDQLRQAAEAFETIFLQKIFSEMRKSSEMLGGKTEMSLDFYNGMLDQAVAESASQHDGFGIRNVLLRSWGVEPDGSSGREDASLDTGATTTSTRRPDAAPTPVRAAIYRPEPIEPQHVAAVALPSATTSSLDAWARPVDQVREAPTGWDDARDLRGVRLWTDAGAAVTSTGPGRVVGVFHESVHGPTVEVEHPGGWTTRYGGLENVDVEVGQWVDDAVRLGDVRTDRDDPYVHFEVRRGAAQFNPNVVVPALAESR